MDVTRICTRCGVEKPLETGFHRMTRNKSGYRAACKECCRLEKQLEYLKPGFQECKREYRRKRAMIPGVVAKEAARHREYDSTPEVKARQAAYRKTAIGKMSQRASKLRAQGREAERLECLKTMERLKAARRDAQLREGL